MGGESRKGAPKGLAPLGGKIHDTKAPVKAANAPKYGPKTSPKTDAIKASSLIFKSGRPTAGIYGETSERA